MPSFEPFAALRPTGADLDDVVAPPYDVIGPAEREALEARSSRNAVHLELPRDRLAHDRYTEASCLLRAWLADGTLVQDEEPAFYAYEMQAELGGRPVRTRGVLGALALEPPGHGILPHEETTSKDVADRLSMLSTCRANLSPIWVLTTSPGIGALAGGGEPLAEATDDDGVHHALRRITDPDAIEAVRAAVAAAPVVVADGHHRFEVANRYRDLDGAAPGADRIMALVVELAEDELTVRGIHRLIDGLSPDADLPGALERWFTVRPLDVDPGDAAAMAALEAELPTMAGPVLVRPGGCDLLVPLDGAEVDRLDSSRLAAAFASLLVGPEPGLVVRNQHDGATIGAMVVGGEAAAGVLLRPATVAQIAATGRGGDRMPAKTTFFWPKPRTGFAYRLLG